MGAAQGTVETGRRDLEHERARKRVELVDGLGDPAGLLGHLVERDGVRRLVRVVDAHANRRVLRSTDDLHIDDVDAVGGGKRLERVYDGLLGAVLGHGPSSVTLLAYIQKGSGVRRSTPLPTSTQHQLACLLYHLPSSRQVFGRMDITSAPRQAHTDPGGALPAPAKGANALWQPKGHPTTNPCQNPVRILCR